jgi:protein TonB
VVDLFSGPATSGTGQGFDDESADGGKTKDSPTALPAYPKHRLEKHRSPQPTTPGPSTKVAKKKPVSHETAPLKSAAKRTSESEESMNTKKSIQDETANPFTDRQHNPESTPETSDARGNGSGQDTLSGSGTGPGRGSGSGLGRGGRSGSGSPVETPFAYGTNPPPPYPSTARRRGWEGEVLLLVDVTAQGEVCNVTVSRSSGYRILDRAALNAGNSRQRREMAGPLPEKSWCQSASASKMQSRSWPQNREHKKGSLQAAFFILFNDISKVSKDSG